MSDEAATLPTTPPERRWRALDRTQRRVLGVLAEKAKTTPDNYPLSLNALVNGSNQKSNRFPQMQLDEERVDEAIEALRLDGAVAVVQGDGRVDKYRHLLYDWLGVDKVELAVMAELLLRGAQTLGELRGRAARMEPIPGISELRPIIDTLRQKDLILLLTPPGRGCVVTHNLYQPEELAKLRSEHGAYVDDRNAPTGGQPVAAPAPPAASPVSAPPPGDAPSVVPPSDVDRPAADELAKLREQIAQLKREQAELREELGVVMESMRGDLDDLKQQLGV